MNSMIVKSMDDAERAARAMAGSGFFQDSKSAAQAVVKILAGAELGFGPFASMTGVNIIQNRPALAANLIAAAVKRSGKYNYRVIEHTAEICSIDFFEDGQKVGNSTYTMKEAFIAGLSQKDTWKKYPRNMLFARAISNGQKWYAPDAFNGATVYTPEELGAEEDAEGNAVISSQDGTGLVPSSTNPDPVPANLRQAWDELAARADKMGIQHGSPDWDTITTGDLIQAGKELRPLVEDAERQAAAEMQSQEER